MGCRRPPWSKLGLAGLALAVALLPCGVAQTCYDTTQNGDETGVDTGGSCNPICDTDPCVCEIHLGAGDVATGDDSGGGSADVLNDFPEDTCQRFRVGTRSPHPSRSSVPLHQHAARLPRTCDANRATPGPRPAWRRGRDEPVACL
eukprot:gene12275-biopygen2012